MAEDLYEKLQNLMKEYGEKFNEIFGTIGLITIPNKIQKATELIERALEIKYIMNFERDYYRASSKASESVRARSNSSSE